MANDHAEALPRAFGGIAQHLKITIRIAKGRNRALADMARNANRLAGPIINEIHAGFTQQGQSPGIFSDLQRKA